MGSRYLLIALLLVVSAGSFSLSVTRSSRASAPSLFPRKVAGAAMLPLLCSTSPAQPPSPPPPSESAPSEDLPSSFVAGTPYVKCGRCQATFNIDAKDLGKGKGRRIRCSVCEHSWFQAREKIFKLREGECSARQPLDFWLLLPALSSCAFVLHGMGIERGREREGERERKVLPLPSLASAEGRVVAEPRHCELRQPIGYLNHPSQLLSLSSLPLPCRLSFHHLSSPFLPLQAMKW